MFIGVPKECKDQEYRVAATPEMVKRLVQQGHHVRVQRDAGTRIGYSNQQYQDGGAEIVDTLAEVYEADFIVKVKEPQPQEVALLKSGQALFCFLHLAPEPELTQALLEKEVIGIAYETVVDGQGRLPLLAPMSEVAGRLSVLVGAQALQIRGGGKGILLGGVPGVPPAKVVILGGGVVGTQAARMAMGLGADVTLIERRIERLRELDDLYGPRMKTFYSTPDAIDTAIQGADLVIGAVLLPGKLAPKILSRASMRGMAGGTFIDVAIDQGGCAETSRITSHTNPTYFEEGVQHYCVPNMPGACARTSTQALTNATAPYLFALANLGIREALLRDPHLLPGLNVCYGNVCYRAVADDGGFEYRDPQDCLELCSMACS